MSADWSVLEIPGVQDVARKAAAKVAAEYSTVTMVEYDDLLQEGLIRLASKPDIVRGYADGPDGLGGLHHWLWCDLTDLARKEGARSNRQYSYEALRSGADE
ncbi:hypothetical protein M2302_002202 [Micromonospora sp. A200]|uniref:hypothetical protein n=1 Tax=Micromonospora sp. A200 TaxID=2940568 RepID=UPI0024730840|nr:hypothetical protein [Micromonospora sp. A200]MDH6462027.1 hypothetical protein [Micromonospora sp. A200]